eukprot:573831_1
MTVTSTFIFIAFLLCIYAPRINSQYSVIWSDTMQQNNGWTTPSPGDVSFAYSSSGCPNPLPRCTKITNEDTGSGSIEKSFDISEYSDIRMRLHITTRDLETSDRCQIYYAYDSKSNKQLFQEYTGVNDEYVYYYDQIYEFPLSASSTIIWIWIQVKADDRSANDNCYVNTFYLDGIPGGVSPNPTITPTEQPSQSPTMRPTKRPTRNPTSSPTLPPSNIPTLTPSRTPTPRPTDPSLLSCGQQAIGDYNDQTLEFYVRLSYAGDLTFDASSSNIVIQSLSAVFGSTPIGADTDHDGILTLYDAIPA